MEVKKHLAGGTLRQVMAEEVKRSLASHSEEPQPIERAAIELGVTPRTIRLWQKTWPELQPELKGSMERLLSITPKAAKKGSKKLKKRVAA